MNIIETLTNQASRSRRRRRPADRRGAVIVLAAFLMIFLMAVMAFSIDMGYQVNTQTEMQRAVDAAALAGAGVLVEGVDDAQNRAVEYLARNPVGESTDPEPFDSSSLVPAFEAKYAGDFEIKTGHWDPEAIDPANGRQGLFMESNLRPSAIKVFFRKSGRPYFFAPVLGRDEFQVEAEAVAMYQPREIMVVLDLSASMNDDSELGAKDTIGLTAVVDNLRQIYGELGSPVLGSGTGFDPVYVSSSTNSTIKNQLGLNGVPYPYPSGSWDEYINYVKSDSTVNNAGYRKKYGGLTLVNFWLNKKPSHAQTPDLWKASAQPITSVKDSVEVFFDYIQEVDTDDQVGLAIYNAQDGEGSLEVSLTRNFDSIESRTREFQAGHYHSWTNIGAGMKSARQHLESAGRPGAFKMIVLLTDGQANWVNGGNNESGARQYVLSEANLAADAGFPVVTVSLGAGADTSLMNQVAEITGGTHFNVPGGQTVAEYRSDLMEVFREIADDRPLKIVR